MARYRLGGIASLDEALDLVYADINRCRTPEDCIALLERLELVVETDDTGPETYEKSDLARLFLASGRRIRLRL